jgi:Uma2 family endonuclease
MATVETIRIGPADHGRPLTLEEFMEAEVEEGYRYELARGVLEATEVPNDQHGNVVCNLYRAVARFDEKNPRMIRRFGGGAEFRIWLPGMITGRNPDLGVVLRGAPRDRRGRRIPSLVGEVISAGSIDRDYRIKRLEYLAYGILEYWIVDPLQRQVTVLTRDGDTWNERTFRDRQIIVSLILPGLETTVAQLWSDLEDDEPQGPDGDPED